MAGRWMPISEARYWASARPAFEAIFRLDDPVVSPMRSGADNSQYPDPFGEPFQPAIRYRGLLFPVFYHLDADTLLNLGDTAKHMGEPGIFRSYTEVSNGYDSGQLGHAFHCRFRLHEDADVSQIVSTDDYWPLENAFYGQSATFGILCSQGDHAVVGSSAPGFLEEFYSRLPATHDQQVRDFMLTLQEERRLHPHRTTVNFWLPRLLKHLFGNQLADALLAEYGFRA